MLKTVHILPGAETLQFVVPCAHSNQYKCIHALLMAGSQQPFLSLLWCFSFYSTLLTDRKLLQMLCSLISLSVVCVVGISCFVHVLFCFDHSLKICITIEPDILVGIKFGGLLEKGGKSKLAD